MHDFFQKISEAAAFIQARSALRPRIGLILGTGLSGVADQVKVETHLPYRSIPHFPKSTVEGHRGECLIGTLGERDVLVLAGRFHYYEGYDMQAVTFPVRVMRHLGIETLIISNAAGGVNPDYRAGDVVFIRDHINLLPENPLRGPNDDRLGARFPDMTHTYDAGLRQLGLRKAKALHIPAHTGVYLALQGPNFETPAEYRFARLIGADMIGMSTVPEVIVARHGGMRVLAFSVISNVAHPGHPAETSLEEVLRTVRRQAPRIRQLAVDIISSIE